jgi:hypothetical protein
MSVGNPIGVATTRQSSPARGLPDVAMHFDTVAFDYEPYPIGLAQNVFDPVTYAAMVDSFPTAEDFVAINKVGVKYSLSQVNNRRGYLRFISRHPVWQRLYDHVKSPAFIRDVLAMLCRHGIDLGLYEQTFGERLRRRVRALKRGRPMPHIPRLRSRFEFSAMPVMGGSIRPHTDDPAKIVTLVVSMLRPDEWRPKWGGGTSVVWPKDTTRSFNLENRYLDFDDVRTLRTFPFQPNQCVVFVKTSNSWHMVAPMTGTDPSAFRKTLTINIETN